MPEDTHPTPEKMVAVSDGFLVHNVTGLRVHIVSRLDGKGYDITRREFPRTDRTARAPVLTLLQWGRMPSKRARRFT